MVNLLVLLPGICLHQGGGFQRLRAHLYGALLYYLQIAQKPEEPETLQTGMIIIIITLFLHSAFKAAS